MGKRIKLTEEQILRFFGPGFGKRLLGESFQDREELEGDNAARLARLNQQKLNLTPTSRSTLLGHNFAPGDKNDRGLFFTNFEKSAKQKLSDSDLPAYGGAAFKMADFGKAKLNDENALSGNANGDALLEAIKDEASKMGISGGLNIIDVLKILHQIKGKGNSAENSVNDENGDSGNITNKEAVNFLNSISIDYILSNFLTVNAPDYMFWRLRNLTKEELERIEMTYGRNFEFWGQRCDGCGATTWTTTVSPIEHDDAHINLEYMGGDASSTTDKNHKLNEEGGYQGVGKKYTKELPFQIHHMNEKGGDNSPLNLACLCPNCHAITGSFGAAKEGLRPETFDVLKNCVDIKTGSLNGALKDNVVNDMAEAIKRGEFERRTAANNLIGVNFSDATGNNSWKLNPKSKDLNKTVQGFGIPDSEKFIKDFNKLFQDIYKTGFNMLVPEETTAKQDTPSEIQKESRFIKEDEDKNSKSQNTEQADPKLSFKIDKNKDDNLLLLSVFYGSDPYILSAFNHGRITLNRMYYEDEEYKDEALIYIRNLIFASALNAAKEYYKKMNALNPKTLPTWAIKGSQGKEDVNASSILNLKSGEQGDRDMASGLFQDKDSESNKKIASRITKNRREQQSSRREQQFSTGCLTAIRGYLSYLHDKCETNVGKMKGKIDAEEGFNFGLVNHIKKHPYMKEVLKKAVSYIFRDEGYSQRFNQLFGKGGNANEYFSRIESEIENSI